MFWKAVWARRALIMAGPLSVWVASLGCPKNRVDTEKLLGSLGVPIRFAATPGRARLVLINSCAFIEPATRESLRTIFDTAKLIGGLKRRPRLVVAGCLPGRYGTGTLASQIPEVDLWLDSASIEDWPRQLGRFLGIDAEPAPGRLCVSKSYAWLKISEGCQHRCSFCAIPSIRGPLRSLAPEIILEEAEKLLADDVRELILVAQDLTAWGRDLISAGSAAGPADLAELVDALAGLAKLKWLRLMYLYPAAVSDKLLKVMAQGAPVLPYLDLPFQHSEARVLASMGRPFQADPREIVAKIRHALPGASLRATLMVGFPGESEQDFQALCDFVAETRFQNLGVFPFYAEEGVPAASLPGQIPEHVKQERCRRIMELQAEISADLLAGRVGE
ncbi:MAG: MiaB/RimO family radical SAM methylthiotransferase, partial [Desulfovibrio sp.]|nr:MiaB/RimO family radical SAM methylthiotransferase [Desulfovibrio sp.]